LIFFNWIENNFSIVKKKKNFFNKKKKKKKKNLFNKKKKNKIKTNNKINKYLSIIYIYILVKTK